MPISKRSGDLFTGRIRSSLTLSGDLDEDRLLTLLTGILEEKTARPSYSKTEAYFLPEPLLPTLRQRSADGCQTPSFLVGFKDSSVRPGQELKGRRLVTRQRGVRLYLNSILSPVSPLYDPAQLRAD